MMNNFNANGCMEMDLCFKFGINVMDIGHFHAVKLTFMVYYYTF